MFTSKMLAALAAGLLVTCISGAELPRAAAPAHLASPAAESQPGDAQQQQQQLQQRQQRRRAAGAAKPKPPPPRAKYFGPDEAKYSSVYRCPAGSFITKLTLFEDGVVTGITSMKCKPAKKGAATTVTLKLGTINPERAGDKREVASLRGFDGAVAGASYDDNLCPGCGFDARFVSALALRRAGGDVHDWTASVGYNNGRYPLTPFFCPGKTKVVGLRVAERPEKLEISPWISGIGVICDDV